MPRADSILVSAHHDHQSLSLTDAHRRDIADAHARLKPIRRAVSVARFSASTTALFAALTLLFTPVFGVVNLLIGGGLGLIAWNEFAGARMLGRLDAGAPLRLAAGQIALGSIIVGYCVWQLWRVLGPNAASGYDDPQLRELMADYQPLIQGLTSLVYLSAIVLTVVFQGGAALYYLTRTRSLRSYLNRTPEWIVEIDRLRAAPERRRAA